MCIATAEEGELTRPLVKLDSRSPLVSRAISAPPCSSSKLVRIRKITLVSTPPDSPGKLLVVMLSSQRAYSSLN